MTAPRLEKLRHFIHEVDRLHREHHRAAPLLDAVAQRLAALVRYDDWLPEEYTLPHPHHYQQYLLHADSGERFSIVSFVWGPGQATPIHDHRVWGHWDAARRGGKPALPAGCRWHTARAGRRHASGSRPVEKVSADDGDIHRVSNALADRVSISIHVYGGNIGAVKRAVYTPEGQQKPFISGYSNRHLPNIWDSSREHQG
ncbi:cysteine dioxygenase [Klebsiella pneumoniae]|uniref:Cysteine dioxygenase n=1 Tax=Klebsiella pneumoniae TaxID=573 RepID=A0A7X1HXL1_KLEPN|nr:cysteine dioxygenase [Klebsiella pneumoniae]